MAQQTLFTCRKSFRWLKCAVTRSSYKENDTQRVTCGDARPVEGREGWRRWSQDWVRIPWITLTCQRHYLIRPRGGFLMRKHLCAAGKARHAGISKNSLEESCFKCAAGKVALMVAAWACCHQALTNRVDRFLCRKKKRTCSIGRACCWTLFKASLDVSTLRRGKNCGTHNMLKTNSVCRCTVC